MCGQRETVLGHSPWELTGSHRKFRENKGRLINERVLRARGMAPTSALRRQGSQVRILPGAPLARGPTDPLPMASPVV